MTITKEKHSFNFVGGDKLSSMGATWFVLYHYYKTSDSSYDKWKEKSENSAKIRLSTYEKEVGKRLSDYGKESECAMEFGDCSIVEYWLEKIQEMDDCNLDKSNFNVTPEEVKRLCSLMLSQMRFGIVCVVKSISMGTQFEFEVLGCENYLHRITEKNNERCLNYFVKGDKTSALMLDSKTKFVLDQESPLVKMFVAGFESNRKIEMTFRGAAFKNVCSKLFGEFVNVEELICEVKLY